MHTPVKFKEICIIKFKEAHAQFARFRKEIKALTGTDGMNPIIAAHKLQIAKKSTEGNKHAYQILLNA